MNPRTSRAFRLTLVVMTCVLLSSMFPALASNLLNNMGIFGSTRLALSPDSSSGRVLSHQLFVMTSAPESLFRQAVTLNPKNANAYRNLGRVYQREGSFAAAVDAFTRSVELDPHNVVGRLGLADSLHGAGYPDRAVAEYELILPRLRDPDMYDVSHKLFIDYILSGREEILSGNYPTAIHQLSRAAQVGPEQNPFLLYYLAIAREGKHEQTERDTTFARLCCPNFDRSSELYLYLGEVVPGLVERGVWSSEESIRHVSLLIWQSYHDVGLEVALRQIVSRYPDHTGWVKLLGELYIRRGDLVQATEIFQELLTRNPNDAEACLQLAQIEEQGGRVREAMNWYKAYSTLAPEDALGRKQLARTGESDVNTIAAMLGVHPTDIELGENMIKNSGFEQVDLQGIKNWQWRYWMGKQRSQAFLVGGIDDRLVYEGNAALRIHLQWYVGEQGVSPAYGEYVASPVRLNPQTIYMLSFYYRTKSPRYGQALVYLRDDGPKGQILLHSGLPDTNGVWRRAVITVRNTAFEPLVARLALRNWGVDDIWADQVELREIILMTTKNELKLDLPAVIIK